MVYVVSINHDDSINLLRVAKFCFVLLRYCDINIRFPKHKNVMKLSQYRVVVGITAILVIYIISFRIKIHGVFAMHVAVARAALQ